MSLPTHSEQPAASEEDAEQMVLTLTRDEAAMLVEHLRERAETIKAESVAQARDLARGPAQRDSRPAAVRLAQRLAIAADLEDLAERIGR